jgi:hypothetical protein
LVAAESQVLEFSQPPDALGNLPGEFVPGDVERPEVPELIDGLG